MIKEIKGFEYCKPVRTEFHIFNHIDLRTTTTVNQDQIIKKEE